MAPTRTSVRLALGALVLIVLVAATACWPPPVFPGPDPSCSVQPTSGLETRTIGERSYLLFVPTGLPSGGDGVPVVLSLHGLNSTAAQHASYTPWLALAPTERFIVAYPQGINNAWGHFQNSPDVTFLRDVIDDLESEFCIDPSHVHVAGHSLGAYMAQRMACDADDVVASVAEFAGGPPTIFFGNTPCQPDRPVTIALLHGGADRLVPVALGRASRDEWVARNGCSPTPQALQVDSGEYLAYGCPNANVLWRDFEGVGHLWPASGPVSDEIAAIMWGTFDMSPHPAR